MNQCEYDEKFTYFVLSLKVKPCRLKDTLANLCLKIHYEMHEKKPPNSQNETKEFIGRVKNQVFSNNQIRVFKKIFLKDGLKKAIKSIFNTNTHGKDS